MLRVAFVLRSTEVIPVFSDLFSHTLAHSFKHFLVSLKSCFFVAAAFCVLLVFALGVSVRFMFYSGLLSNGWCI